MDLKSIKVEIITIGDEILIGQIVDTNSAWMGVELNKAGFEIAQITSVHDNEKHILDSIDMAFQRADVVLVTGGIGPTKDDITKQVLCKYFETKLVFNDEVYQNIEQLLIRRSSAMNELTKAQALVPETCTVIQNLVGTAPITWFGKGGKVLVSMPGVPGEMKTAMENEIIPRLTNRYKTATILHKNVLVQGYPESALALKIADWENNLPEGMHLAYLPNYSIVKLRLTSSSENPLELEFEMNQQIELLSQILGDAIIAFEDVLPQKHIGELLLNQGKTLSTAESCTGGNIAHLITTIPGSSEYFKGSVVAYSNEIKTSILRVNEEGLKKNGAVSREVVEQMAQGVRKLMKTDFSVSTSGIAGPDGGTDEKPVGTVWIAVSSKDRTISKECHFGKDRVQNIERTTQTALLMLKEII